MKTTPEYRELASQLATSQSDLSSSQDELTAKEAGLEDTQADLSDAQADVVTAQADLKTVEGDIPRREQAVKTAEGDLDARDAALGEAERSVTKREKAVGIVETQVKSNTVSGEGMYKVGEDIDAGTYKTQGGRGCYYAVLNSTDTFDIAVNGNVNGPAFATVQAGQYLELSGCADWVLQP